MKLIIILTSILISVSVFGQQKGYDKIEKFERSNNGWAKVYLNDKVGFITDYGEEIVRPIYDEIGRFGEFRKNWAMVHLDDKVGFIDGYGEVVVPLKYDLIDSFKRGKAVVRVGNKLGIINKYGEEIVAVGDIKFVE